MYTKPKFRRSSIEINDSTEGETLEAQIERMITNKEPLTDKAPLVFTERKDGVRAETNIRTDRWEIAVDATSKIAKSYSARREERMAEKEAEKEANKGEERDAKGKSIQGTQQADK